MDLIESGVRDPINHWYYRHKFWFIKRSPSWKNLSTNSLVDIGAGSALFSKELLRQKLAGQVVAVDTGYELEHESVAGVTYSRTTDYAGFTHFLLTDVLEHVEDDYKFLRDIVKEADINASFIITVPALMNLWSGHDDYLKHFRRYSKNDLCQVVQQSGLSIRRVRYTYSTLYLIAYGIRKLSRRQQTTSQMKENNWLVSAILRMLLVPDRWISFAPFGVSLFLEAVKDE